jgi:catechol 2,3-dioxygenase-like lactoylglutathione lyase family enzyme
MKQWISITAWLLTAVLADSMAASEGAPPSDPPPAFWHLGLLVADLAVMDRFYGDVIGLQREPQLLVEDSRAASGTEGAIVVDNLDALMAVDGVRIEIRHYSDPEHRQFLELLHYPDHPSGSAEHWTNRPLGFSHLGISVADIDSVLVRMKQSGLGERISGPQRLEEFGGLRYAFLKDPEGNMVELMEVSGKQAP